MSSTSKKHVAGYILDRRIGKGSYATVWKGHVDGGDEVVAVKVVSRQTVTETAQLRQEVDVLRRISHVNIVRFRDLKKSASHFYLVLEYCAGGDLSQFLKEQKRVQEHQARAFLTQIAAGLCVLHRENVIHRDLKPQNILLSNNTQDAVLKIADFGFARALQPQDMAATVCGSPLYMAPEILRHEPYDARADLWSAGAILYELLIGKPPFSGANPMQLLANIEKCDRVSFEGAQAQVSAEGQDFLRSLLVRLPKDRLCSREFARHSYVRLGPLPDSRDTMLRDAEAVVFTRPESELTVDWCDPPSADGPQNEGAPSSGTRGPIAPSLSVGGQSSPALIQSPEMSPRDSAPARATIEAEDLQLQIEHGGTAPVGSATQAEADTGPQSSGGAADTGAGSPRAAGVAGTADAAPPSPTKLARTGAGGAIEEEFVVVTEQKPPIPGVDAVGRGRNGDFFNNLKLTALALEQLAARRKEQFPLDALALLMRALGLLEKALNILGTCEETCLPLRAAFHRMLEASESIAEHVKATSHMRSGVESPYPPARPNQAILEHAMQQAKDAAVALSKGREDSGWEAFCRERLSSALLLLELLSSEADGEDLSILSSYTAPISQLVTEIECFCRSRGSPHSPMIQLAVH